MNVKLAFTGVLSIIGLVITISSLAIAQDMLEETTNELKALNPQLASTMEESISSSNLYCTKASDCKQDPKDCSTCVNILKGGFTILNKCDDNKMPCYCTESKCTINN